MARVGPDAWFGLYVLAVIATITGSCATCRWAEHTWPDQEETQLRELERRVGQLEGKEMSGATTSP